MEVTIDDIQEQLEEFCLSADEQVSQKMKELCFVMNLSAEDIVHHWVSFIMSKKKDCLPPTLALLEEMEKEFKEADAFLRNVSNPKSSTSNLKIHDRPKSPFEKLQSYPPMPEGFALEQFNELKKEAMQLSFVGYFEDSLELFSKALKIYPCPKVKKYYEETKEQIKATPKARKPASTVVYNASNIDSLFEHCFEGPKGDDKTMPLNVDKSPLFSPKSMTPTRFTPSRKYSSRTGVGNVVCSFGGKSCEIGASTLTNVDWNYASEFSCNICDIRENRALRESYHYMSEKMLDHAGVLNDTIQDAAEFFISENEVDEWGSIHLPSMEPVSVVGRICCENGERFNAASLLLEGSREHSSGRVVPLDVSRLEQFSFFPGQIIGGTGTNISAKKFVMDFLFEGICPPPCPKVPSLENCIDSLGVVVAAGPFATSDTMSFEPLWDLLNYVQTSKPHALILIGPFVDIKNQFVESGKMNETFDDIFNKLISEILKKIELLSTKVVLVPSTRDAHHDSVYPTPPFSIDSTSKRLYLAPDPCILNIEGVLFAITSTDILFHMGKEEISHPQLSDRLGRLCGHILTQRNFYPLYPPNEDVNIDYAHYELHGGIPIMPHILIVPSDFRYFMKDVHGCCCINPERLTKHSSGGTYARLKISNIKKDEYKGSIINSIQGQVLRI